MPFAIPMGGGVGGDAPKTVDELIATRKNPVYAAREQANTINMLGYHGGRPYVDARLTRFPAESTIAWEGSIGARKEGQFSSAVETTGRKQRAYVVNNCARIAEKIRQYVFQTPPTRENADPQFVQDANRMGQGVNTVMGQLCNYMTTSGWGWLGIDAPRVVDADGNPMRPTLAQQRSQKLRMYWNAYSALEVPDWHIDEAGAITWLITEGLYTDNADPRGGSVVKRMRRLWEPGKVTEVRYDFDPNSLIATPENIELFESALPYNRVPFVLAGTPSPLPWWFDDVEAINRAIMDLESANDQAFFGSVYPQLVLPQSMIEGLIGQTDDGADIAKRVEAIIGLDSAIAERSEDKGITRWIMPPPFATGMTGKELDRKRQLLYDTVGLALKVSSRQVESAEAKEWDHLDAQAVLRERAQVLEETETQAVEISHEWDTAFSEYEPRYASSFDVGNIHEEIKSLVEVSATEMPDEVRRLHMMAVADRVAKLGGVKLTTQQRNEINQAIEAMDFQEPIQPLAAPSHPAPVDGSNDFNAA